MPIKPILYMLAGAGFVLVIIGGRTLIQDQKAKDSIKGVETEIINTPTLIPTAIPTETPTPTLIPTNKPVYIKPTAIPTPKLTNLTIGDKTYSCQDDNSNEVVEADIKYKEAMQKWIDCGNRCMKDITDCQNKCSDFTGVCRSGCNTIKCSDTCSIYLSQMNPYRDILNNLINRYCN